MKLTHGIATILLVGSSLVAVAGEVTPSVPETPNKAARYLIYLHGSGIDRDGVNRAKENFRANTRRLADQGVTVIAEIRPHGAIRKAPEDLDAYARKVATQVERLLKAHVSPRNITVVGFSRGAVIALMVSTYVGHPEVGYVILAGCFSEGGAFKQYVPVLMSDYSPRLKGRFLSLVDESDPDFSSCSSYFSRALQKSDYSEMILRTGRGHDLFSEPADAWIRPVEEWASAK